MTPTPIEVEIILVESLEPRWQVWFAGLALSQTPAGHTRLAGCLPDQAALHGVLQQIRDLNLKIISIQVQN